MKNIVTLALGMFLLAACGPEFVQVPNKSTDTTVATKKTPVVTTKAPPPPPTKVNTTPAPRKEIVPTRGTKSMGTCQGLTKGSNARMDCCIKEAYKCYGLKENVDSDSSVDSYSDACAAGDKTLLSMMRKDCTG